MSTLTRTRPQIYIERARETHVIHLVLGDIQLAGVVITRTPENAAVVDYFYERLKDGLYIEREDP
jgi:hypothetical protein